MDGADQAAAPPPADPAPAEPSLAAKIDRLFRTTRPPGSTAEYTYEQVAAEIADRGGPTISASYLYLLRRGLRDNPTKRHLEALAGFFGVPAGYFLDTHDPAEEDRLGLLSALRDPRVHGLVLTAAALPEAELDVVAQLVGLVGDLEALRGTARRRGLGAEPGSPGNGAAVAAPSPERDRLAELELTYARICLQDGLAEEGLRHLAAVVAMPGATQRRHDEAGWLTALAHQALGHPEKAVAILARQLDGCLDGSCELPLVQVGEELCRLALAAGDRVMAADAARRTLTGLEQRGLSGTAEHLRLAVTLMDTYLDLGQLLHAAALAEQLIPLADELADPQRQSEIYLAGARLAEARGGTREAVELAERALSRLDGAAAGGPFALDAARLRLAAASCLLRRPVGHRPGEDGQAAAAVEALEACRSVLDARGTPEDRSRWAVQRALADLALAEPVAAEVNARRALAQLSERQRRPVTVEAQLVLGDALRAQNRHAHADAAHEQAARALAGLPEPRWRPWSAGVWRSLGDRWLARGCCDRAADAYRRALDADGLVASRPAPA